MLETLGQDGSTSRMRISQARNFGIEELQCRHKKSIPNKLDESSPAANYFQQAMQCSGMLFVDLGFIYFDHMSSNVSHSISLYIIR